MISHSKPTIEQSDIMAMQKVLRSNYISSGKIAKEFEDELKKFFKAKKVLLTSSGFSAIVEALILLNVKPGDEVIIPAYVCSSVARAIKRAGARPKVVDINVDDYNISYSDTVKNIKKRTKAIIVPHMFGNPIKDIQKFAKLGVHIIEDVAQSIGGKYKGKRLGSFGDMSICSFYATKMITTGEGGSLIINNAKLAKKYDKGSCLYHMPDFQAILGIKQLKKIDSFIRKRQQISAQFIRGLKDVKGLFVSNPENSIFYRFIVEAKNNKLKEFVSKMRKQKIAVSRFSDLSFSYLKLPIKNYPNTKKALERVVSIPLYASLTKKQVNSIINISKKTFIGNKHK